MREIDTHEYDDPEEGGDAEDVMSVSFCLGTPQPNQRPFPFFAVEAEDGTELYEMEAIKAIPRANLAIVDFHPGIRLSEDLSCRSDAGNVSVDYGQDGEVIGLTMHDMIESISMLSALGIQLERRKGKRRRLAEQFGRIAGLDGGRYIPGWEKSNMANAPFFTKDDRES
jgi:hypothetical protein